MASLSMPGANAEGGKKGNPARRIGSTTVLHCPLFPFSVGRRSLARSLGRLAHQNRCVNRSERRRSQRTLDENLSGGGHKTFLASSMHGPRTGFAVANAFARPAHTAGSRPIYTHAYSFKCHSMAAWELERHLAGEAV